MSSTKNYIQVDKVIGLHTLYSKDSDDLYYRTFAVPYATDGAAYDALVAGEKRNGSVYRITGADRTLKVLYGPVVGFPVPDNVIDYGS